MSALHVVALVLLVFVIIGVPQFGVWGHNYGMYPSGVGLLLLILVIFLLFRG